jgi:hypothetical protein
MGTEKSRHQTPLTLKKQGEKNSFSFIEPMLALRVPELPAGWRSPNALA